MSQKKRPISDVLNTNWSPSPLYAQVNQAAPDDTTFISPTASSNLCRMYLAPGFFYYPQPSGALTVTVRARYTGAFQSTLLVELFQDNGTVPIAFQVFVLSTSFANYVLRLTPTQQALITNY